MDIGTVTAAHLPAPARRVRRLGWNILTGCLLTVPLAACGTASFTVPGTARPVCEATFDLGGAPDFSLNAAIDHAARATTPLTASQLVEAAGFRRAWDTMVIVGPGTTSLRLNEKAGTPGMCWQGLPESAYDDNYVWCDYLFLHQGRPVATASWVFLADRTLDHRASTVLHPNTVLTPVPSTAPDGEPTLRVEAPT